MGYPFKSKSKRDRIRQQTADKMEAAGTWNKVTVPARINETKKNPTGKYSGVKIKSG